MGQYFTETKNFRTGFFVYITTIYAKSEIMTNHFFREYNILISGIPHVNILTKFGIMGQKLCKPNDEMRIPEFS